MTMSIRCPAKPGSIDLQKFVDHGVNLANVNTMTIGFGAKDVPAAGGAGIVYFDDISTTTLFEHRRKA